MSAPPFDPERRNAPDRSAWSNPETVAGFAESPPNARLLQFASDRLRGRTAGRALDIGCGAGRNGVPLARLGWHVVGTDLSWPMLSAAAGRTRVERPPSRLDLILGSMDAIPARADCSI